MTLILQSLSKFEENVERKKDPHANDRKQHNISVKEIKYLLKVEHQ